MQQKLLGPTMWKVLLLSACAAGIGFVFCDEQCGANERYVACPNTMCIPQNCSQRGLPVPCPVLGPEGTCPGKPACICVENYLRDDRTGVCIPSKKVTAHVEASATSSCGCGEHPPKCGKNEVYNNGSICVCRATKCSELGYPLNCDKKCKPGCICKDGYVRDDNGVCIPVEKCDSCGGDNNAKSGCGNHCGNTCATYKTSPVICTLPCQLNGCDCRDGFKYDTNVNACVEPCDCTPTCKANEEYSSCVNGGCVRRNCSQVGKPVPCPKLDVKDCIKGCVCVKGYLRDANGTCVPEDKCTPTCGKNEYYDNCYQGCSNQSCPTIGQSFNCPNEPAGKCKSGCRCKPGYYRTECNDCVPESECPIPKCPKGEVFNKCPAVKCDADYCLKNKDSPQYCPIGIVCDKPRCVCGPNRKRDWKTGKCILITDCPPFPCDCNEVYQACPLSCPDDSCNKKPICPRNLIIENCRPQCRCAKGYCRNAKGTCVPVCSCSADSPAS